MRKFQHTALLIIKRVNKVLTELGAAASYAIKR